ncbi:MAG: GldG family protein, partial [Planctomycetales bacterium]
VAVLFMAAAMVGFCLLAWKADSPLWNDNLTYTTPFIMETLLTFALWGIGAGIIWWFISQWGEHFLLRTACLVVLSASVSTLAARLPWRYDLTVEQLSSLSPQTVALIEGLADVRGSLGPGKPRMDRFNGAESMSQRDGEYAGAYLHFETGPLKDKGERRVTRYDGETRTFHFDNGFKSPPKRKDQFVLTRPAVRIKAFLSPETPEMYVQTRLNLLNTLREFDSIGGNKILLEIHNTEQLSKEAVLAEEQYGVTPRQVQSSNRGTHKSEQVFLGVAFESGDEKVVVPFFDRGIPVEYELTRSITSVSRQQRKKIGILTTDAQLYGQFNMQAMRSTPNQAVITELEKQYEVARIDEGSEIPDDLDAMLVVQPSSLSPDRMRDLIAAVREGLPT